MKDTDLSNKTARVLFFLLILFLFIAYRVWHLTIIERENKLDQAQKPQKRVVIEYANRGPIYDRYQLPLALNRIRYHAAIYYSHIRQIPSIRWEKGANGIKTKRFARKEYIQKLAKLLAKELDLDADHVEDLIHCKASLLPHIPFIIKENISENEYFRLRALQRDWSGLCSEIASERFYPKQNVAGEIIGYLGAMNPQEYLKIAHEMNTLKQILEKTENDEQIDLPKKYHNLDMAYERYHELKEKAYSFNDWIGKMGLEKSLESKLRGSHGKKTFSVDIKGNFLKELPENKKAIPGKRVDCSISVELQRFAEELLIHDEKEREGVSRYYDSKKKENLPLKQPWIKGGSIVAMDPNTGEILALASTPRFNPNDFIIPANNEMRKTKQQAVHHWLETWQHMGSIWDGHTPIEKELFDTKKNELTLNKEFLSWELFIQTILPEDSEAFYSLEKIKNIKNAILLQEDVETLKYFSHTNNASLLFDCLFSKENGHMSIYKDELLLEKEKIKENLDLSKQEIAPAKKRLFSFLSKISHNKDKLFVIDLCRVVVFSPAFSDELIKKIGEMSLSKYWSLTKTCMQLEKPLKEQMALVFHENFFKEWKKKNQKSFITEMRNEEKKYKKIATPFVDYLNKKEKELFTDFWNKKRLLFFMCLLKDNFIIDKHESLAPYVEVCQSRASYLSKTLKEALTHLDLLLCMDFLKTMRSFSALDRPLLCKYPRLRSTNKQQLEKHLASSFYPLNGYNYARSFAYRQSAPLGSIFKLVTGYAGLMHEYNKSSFSKKPINPLQIIDEKKWDSKARSTVVGYSLDGKPYPRFYKGGRLPASARADIGKIDITSALEQSSNPYFSIMASDVLDHPSDLLTTAKNFGFGEISTINLPGEIKGFLPIDIDFNQTGLYSFAIGQHTLIVTPLQVSIMLSSLVNGGKIMQPSLNKIEKESLPIVRKKIEMPEMVKNALLMGMHKVIFGEKGKAKPSRIKKLRKDPKLKEYYLSLENQFIGKSSTAEIMYNPYILPSSKAHKYQHIWFGGISFNPSYKKFEKPELVVVVYLKYGDGGKEAAPLAAAMIKKYREIKEKNQIQSL